MNLKELKDMITLMNENNLVEIEIEREGLRIRIKKGICGVPEVTQERFVIQHPSSASVAPIPVVKETASSSEIKRLEVKAPMVGTFYGAASPDAPAFVEVGSEIEPGQVICIIEAMKLMNEIKSEVKGRVVEILIENAQPVEFGQILFLIEPA